MIKDQEKERIGAPAREARGGPRGARKARPLFFLVFYYFQSFSFVFRWGSVPENLRGGCVPKNRPLQRRSLEQKSARFNAFATSIFLELSPPWNAAPPVIGVLTLPLGCPKHKGGKLNHNRRPQAT